MKVRGGAAWMVIAMLAVCAPAAAVETAEEPPGQEKAHSDHERNEIGVFIGVTAGGEQEGDGEEDPTGTIGIEYRRNLSRLIGVGLLLEFAGGQRRDHVGIVPLTFFLGPKAQLVVGGGWERVSGTNDFEALGRLGFGYIFELVPGNVIRPEVNVDFVDGETLVVVGASIGWSF